MTNTVKKPRVDWVDAAKGISILLVVLYHCTSLSEAAGFEVTYSLRLNHLLQPIRMPLFFFVAGIFAGSAVAKSWPDLFRRKVLLMAWLLLLWALIRIAWSTWVLPVFPSEVGNWWSVPMALVRPSNGLWFLWSLAIFFVVAKILRGRLRVIGLVIALVASIGGMGYAFSDSGLTSFLNYLPYRNSIKYFFFFFVACSFPMAALSLDRIPLFRGLIFASIAMITTLWFRDHTGGVLMKGLIGFVSCCVGVAWLLFISRFSMRLPGVGALLSWIGRNTLPIYVSHALIITLFLALVAGVHQKVGPIMELFPFVLVPIVVALSLLVRVIVLKVGGYWMYELPARNRDVRKSASIAGNGTPVAAEATARGT